MLYRGNAFTKVIAWINKHLGKASMGRHWQRWDVGNIAETIETYWRGNQAEQDHRRQLGDLVAPFLLGSTKNSVLEVGCGSGLVYEQLVPRLMQNEAYTGIDVTDNMLAIARARFPEARFLKGDGYALDFADSSFNLVICFEVLGHILEIEQFIGELLRVTRRVCIFTVWPSAAAEIVTSEEEIDGTRFLHRQYPDAYITKIVREAAPRCQLRRLELNGGSHRAYIIHRRSRDQTGFLGRFLGSLLDHR